MQNFLLLTYSTLSYAMLCSEGVVNSTLVLYLIGESIIHSAYIWIKNIFPAKLAESFCVGS